MKNLKAIIVFIISYLKGLWLKTKALESEFDKELIKAKNGKEACKSIIKNFSSLYWIWKMPIFSIILLTLAIRLIQFYFLYILVAAIVVLWIVDNYKIQRYQQTLQAQQNKNSTYEFLAEFIFNSLQSLTQSLPIKTPQDIISIKHNPQLQDYGSYYVYCFKLIKTSSDKIADEKIDFSEKVLKSLILDELNRYEQLHNDGYTYAGNLRKIELDSLSDMGDYLLVKIAFLDNQKIYNYIFNKSNPSTLSHQTTIPFDKDF